MTLPRRGGLAVAVAIALTIASIQAYDAFIWATSPWLGVTLGDHGRIMARGPGELPAGLRAVSQHGSLQAISVRVGDSWSALYESTDNPLYDRAAYPLRAYDRLRVAIAHLDVGSTVDLRVLTSTGDRHDVELSVRRVPRPLLLQRIGLYAGIGLLIVIFGGAVLRARPDSPTASAFAVMAAALGGQLLTTQVVGGFPSRFYWLSLVGCYAAPVACARVALALEPAPWRRWPWIGAMPWLTGFAFALGATLHGSLLDDTNTFLDVLRILCWAFFASYLIFARARTESRQQRRLLEYCLAGMALTFAVPIVAYVRPRAADEVISPWVMLPLVLFPLIIGYGILKHRLFDVEVALRRGLATAALLILSAVVYGSTTVVVSQLAGPHVATGSTLWMVTNAALAVAFGATLHPRLRRLVDRSLNPTRFGYLQAMRQASIDVASLSSERQTARQIVSVLVTEAGLAGVVVYLRSGPGYRLAASGGRLGDRVEVELTLAEPLVRLTLLVGREFNRDDFADNPRLQTLHVACAERMDDLGIELVVPFGARDDEPAGLLGLTGRRDGEPVNSEDMELIRMLLDGASKALAQATTGDPRATATVEIARPAPQVGSRFGRYRLSRRIASGGMGSVFEARDEALDRAVAVKFLRAGQSVGQLHERLRREARVLASLRHPGIVHLYAIEEEGGHTFLVFELLDGATLRHELERSGPLPPRAALAIVVDLAHALAYAHARGVLHRDIKLENVIRTAAGAVKLTDFGLARLRQSEESSLTESGVVVGTLAYLAPELLVGARANVRSDLYSLGVLLEALLIGHERTAGDIRDVSARHFGADLSTLLARMTAAEPSARYASYAELIAAVEAIAARPDGGLGVS